MRNYYLELLSKTEHQNGKIRLEMTVKSPCLFQVIKNQLILKLIKKMSTDKLKVSILLTFASSLQKTAVFLGNQESLLGRQYVFLWKTVIFYRQITKISKLFLKTHF